MSVRFITLASVGNYYPYRQDCCDKPVMHNLERRAAHEAYTKYMRQITNMGRTNVSLIA